MSTECDSTVVLINSQKMWLPTEDKMLTTSSQSTALQPRQRNIFIQWKAVNTEAHNW